MRPLAAGFHWIELFQASRRSIGMWSVFIGIDRRCHPDTSCRRTSNLLHSVVLDVHIYDMAMRASRRNGKQPSCEPCRKSKIRCDHGQPVCDRCQRRGLESRCFYHPAPLTKPRPPLSPSSSPGLTNPSDPSISARNLFVNSTRGSVSSPTVINHGFAITESHPTGVGVSDKAIHDEHLASVLQLLAPLRHLKLIHKCMTEYYAIGQTAAIVPGPFILPVVSALQKSFSTSSSHASDVLCDNGSIMFRLADSTLRSTKTKMDVTSSLGPSDFCARYTGENLRLESLGLVYSIAGRSCLHGTSRDEARHDDFVQEMFRCSSTCLQLARELAPQVNDATLWLGYENLQLANLLQEDASKSQQEQYAPEPILITFVTISRPSCLATTRRLSYGPFHNGNPPRVYIPVQGTLFPCRVSKKNILRYISIRQVLFYNIRSASSDLNALDGLQITTRSGR